MTNVTHVILQPSSQWPLHSLQPLLLYCQAMSRMWADGTVLNSKESGWKQKWKPWDCGQILDRWDIQWTWSPCGVTHLSLSLLILSMSCQNSFNFIHFSFGNQSTPLWKESTTTTLFHVYMAVRIPTWSHQELDDPVSLLVQATSTTYRPLGSAVKSVKSTGLQTNPNGWTCCRVGSATFCQLFWRTRRPYVRLWWMSCGVQESLPMIWPISSPMKLSTSGMSVHTWLTCPLSCQSVFPISDRDDLGRVLSIFLLWDWKEEMGSRKRKVTALMFPVFECMYCNYCIIKIELCILFVMDVCHMLKPLWNVFALFVFPFFLYFRMPCWLHAVL